MHKQSTTCEHSHIYTNIIYTLSLKKKKLFKFIVLFNRIVSLYNCHSPATLFACCFGEIFKVLHTPWRPADAAAGGRGEQMSMLRCIVHWQMGSLKWMLHKPQTSWVQPLACVCVCVRVAMLASQWHGKQKTKRDARRQTLTIQVGWSLVPWFDETLWLRKQ